MKKTAQEIAKEWKDEQTKAWLLDCTTTVPELFEFVWIVARRANVSTEYELARTMIEMRIAEKQEKTSLRMEEHTKGLIEQTDRLIGFTKGLYWLTAALLILGVVQVVIAFTCRP